MTDAPLVPAEGAVDRSLLSIYLNDHLAGAVAGLRRMRRTAGSLSGTSTGAQLHRIADEVQGERDELRALIRSLDLPESRAKQLATWTGERLGRLKGNGRVVRPSPLTALLEVEVLRSAVMGKRGLWQTLHGIGPALGVDPARPAELVAQSDAQLAALDQVHAYVRAHALRSR